jgi:hypothetical protein
VRDARRLLLAVGLVLIGVPALLRLALVPSRGFGPDELEHSHFAWRISQGELPYRDYFEHHTPFFHYMLRGLFARHDVTHSGDEAIAALFDARRAAWVFGSLALVLTFLLGRDLRGLRQGLLAALLLGNTGVFLWRGFESRPDVPAMALVSLAVWLAARGFHGLADGPPRYALLLASGLALGSAAMFTQKVLFFGPGLAVYSLWLVAEKRLLRPRRERVLAVAALGGAFLVPILLTLAFFAAHGALRDFIECNFLVNTRWPGLAAREFVLMVLYDDALPVLLAFAGLVLALGRFDAASLRRGEPLLALAFLSPVLCLFVHPAVTLHYFLLFVPLGAVYAADALVAGADALAARFRRVPADVLLLLAATLLSVPDALRLREAYGRGNWSTLQGLRFVIANTAPWEPTLDGFSGLGAFRPSAFHYPFVNSHTRFLMGESEAAKITDALRSGRVAPRLLFMTQDLKEGLEPEALRFVERQYSGIHQEPIRVRLFDGGGGWWSDEGKRPLGWTHDEQRPHVFVDDGWRIPAEEDGVAVRRTRARRSVVLLPLRRPRDGSLTLRARADDAALPFAVEIVSNGRALGRLAAVSGWHEYRVEVPADALRIGINAIALRFFAQDPPDDRRTELAVEWIAFDAALSPAEAARGSR